MVLLWLPLEISCGETWDPSATVAPKVQAAKTTRRPAAVPADYVVTANGYIHPSCVVTLAAGEEIVGVSSTSTRVRGADGVVRDLGRCEFPSFRSNGEVSYSPTPSSASIPTTIPGSEEELVAQSSALNAAYGSNQPGVAVKALRSSWVVPQGRADEGADPSQISIWPGLQNAPSGSNWVMQPLLQMYETDSWIIKNCYDPPSGILVCGTTFVTVSPGDVISGTVTGSNCSSTTGVCSNWTVAMTDMTTLASPAPLPLTSFTDVAARVVAGSFEEVSVGSCSELPIGYPAKLRTEWSNFSNVWSSGTWTTNKVATTPDCKYDSWVAQDGSVSSLYVGWWTGYNAYPAVFDAGYDERFYEGLPDWAGGQYKSECDVPDAVVGLSANASTLRAHSVLCTYNGPANSKLLHPELSIAVDFSTTSRSRESGSMDWDKNFFKGECAANEAVTGVAQSTDGKLTKVLCTRLYQRTRVAGACYPRIFSTGDNRGNSAGDGDWAYGYFKGQCDLPGQTTVVKGVSRFQTTGQAHAILCCPTTFTP